MKIPEKVMYVLFAGATGIQTEIVLLDICEDL